MADRSDEQDLIRTRMSASTPRPFRTEPQSLGAGMIHNTDLLQRTSYLRSRFTGGIHIVFDPDVVFDEEYIIARRCGKDDVQATETALVAAKAALDKAAGLDSKTFLHAQQRFSVLQDRLAKVSSMPSPDSFTHRNGTMIQTLGQPSPPSNMMPSGAAPSPRLQSPSPNQRIEQFTYTSVLDGQSRTFKKRINGEPPPLFLEGVLFAAFVELVHGGDPLSVLAAAGIEFRDDFDKNVFSAAQWMAENGPAQAVAAAPKAANLPGGMSIGG